MEEVSQALWAEAGALLDASGLLEILSRYGRPHVQGSYALRLMTWRDLDIYLEAEELPAESFFAMGGQIAQALRPIRMSFRNNHIEGDAGLPDGLYWGIRVGSTGQDGWKIDIWALNEEVCQQKLAFHEDLASRMTRESREPILRIKSRFCHHPEYRRSFSSMTIYEAVLNHGVSDVEEFRKYVREQRLGIDL